MSTAGVALVVAAVLAVTDWVAVATGRSVPRVVTKPGTMVALVVAATTLDPSPAATQARSWFVVALVLSLVGDALLMLPEAYFLGGLVAFLASHIAYIGGMTRWRDWPDGVGLAVGIVVVLAGALVIGRPLVATVRRRQPSMAVPVAAYVVVISAMVVVALGTAMALLVVAALLFYSSDAILGWNRFVGPQAWAHLAVMVTYHLAQGAFVLSLAA